MKDRLIYKDFVKIPFKFEVILCTIISIDELLSERPRQRWRCNLRGLPLGIVYLHFGVFPCPLSVLQATLLHFDTTLATNYAGK